MNDKRHSCRSEISKGFEDCARNQDSTESEVCCCQKLFAFPYFMPPSEAIHALLYFSLSFSRQAPASALDCDITSGPGLQLVGY